MKTYLKVFYITSIFLIFSNLELYAQDSIQKILKEKKIPRAWIAIISDNKVILQKGLGKADVKNDINVNTIFRLGSVSKLFVGLAILKLQEEGLINLKDPELLKMCKNLKEEDNVILASVRIKG